MAPGPSVEAPRKIIREWAAEGTGDSYYQTADGRVWVTDHNWDSEPATGGEKGTVNGGRMDPRSQN